MWFASFYKLESRLLDGMKHPNENQLCTNYSISQVCDPSLRDTWQARSHTRFMCDAC